MITLATLQGQPQGQAQVPDAVKGKKLKLKIEHEGREDRAALTPAHEAAESELAAMAEDEHGGASKGLASRPDALPGQAPYRGPEASLPGSGDPEGTPLPLGDAEPGPGTYPEPDGIAAQDFRRPYLEQGHGADSPQSTSPAQFPVPPAPPQPGEFGRGYIAPGHAADSPVNSGLTVPQPLPPSLAQVHGSGPIAAGLAAHQPGVYIPTYPPATQGR
jgi:hypothetical protein